MEDDEDTITPMGLSKRKRAILDDEEDEEVPKEKKTNSPGKECPAVEQKASEEASVSDDDVSTCSYCSAKIPEADLPAHMSKEHAWLDAEIDDKVTYGGSELGNVDYDDVEVDYDEEGDDFFKDGNLEDRT